MANQEQQLIEAIKAKPGHRVFPGRDGGSIIVCVQTKSSVRQQSVWLGRSSTVSNLQRILAD